LVSAFKQAKRKLKCNRPGQTWVEYSIVTTFSVLPKIQRMGRSEKAEGIKMLGPNTMRI
jgi:hypothetical protein